MRRTIAVLLTVFICLAGRFPAGAQSAVRAALFALDTASFPTMSVSLDVFDTSGNFVTGLTSSQLTLLENDLALSPLSLQEQQPGVRFAVALDPGAAFAFRGGDAVSRLNKVNNVLRSWAAAHDDSLGDDLSLVPTGGVSSVHLFEGAAFAQVLSDYQPNLQTQVPSLDTLSLALDTVSETGGQVGMKRLVLYIASPPSTGSISALQNLTQRALDLDIRVHVWIVSSSDFFSTSGATALKDLAIRTGGMYALFSGTETLPDPEIYLVPLRHSYFLTYSSAIRTPGFHSLVAQVDLEGAALTSPAIGFDLDVQPPNPILVAPPGQIVRQGMDPLDTDFAAFLPRVQTIDAIIEFPDGLPRPLARTALYVDGVLADENTAAPFDLFTWNLENYTQSGSHLLQVQVTDTLGLEKTSLGISLDLTVVQPERGVLAFLARNSHWVILGAVGIAGTLLTLTLLAGHRKASVSRKPVSKRKRDPLTAPVESDVARQRHLLPWVRAAASRHVLAYLQPLGEDGEPLDSPLISVTAQVIIFGSDPLRATRLLEDASVSPLHARLRVDGGKFILSDERSTAGTWVNYERLDAPCSLSHADLLHIGRLSFRFLLRLPPDLPAPRILPIK